MPEGKKEVEPDTEITESSGCTLKVVSLFQGGCHGCRLRTRGGAGMRLELESRAGNIDSV